MTTADLLRLLDAGFTKDEIMEIIAPPSDNDINTTPEHGAAEDPAPAAPSAPGAEDDPFAALTTYIDSKFAKLEESLKHPLMPSMGDIKPMGTDDIVRKFFKEG